MKKTIFSFKPKALALALGFAVAFTSVPATISFAAPPQTANFSDSSYTDTTLDNLAVENVVKAITRAKRTGKKADIEKANSLIAALSPANRVRLYVRFSRDYYFKNYRTAKFKFFDVEKYLLFNNDVRLAAFAANADDMYSYALAHYLERGIFEGRSSQTSFDPVVAILSRPDVLNILVSSGMAAPDDIYSSYVSLTGKTVTTSVLKSEQVAQVLSPQGSESSSSGSSGSGESAKGASSGSTTPVTPSQPSGSGDESGSQDDDYEEPDEPDEPEEPQDRVVVFRNNKSTVIEPYVLYDLDVDSFDFVTNTYTDGKNNGKSVTVNFYNKNYDLAKELAKDKKYTFMIYMCGTDQEVNAGYRRVTQQISSMMKGRTDNVNVLLFLGGTESYLNEYVNNDISGVRSGIYYLNPAGLTEDVKTRFSQVDLNKESIFNILAGTEKDVNNDAKGLTYNDIINANTLIKLSTTTAIDMADPALLAGFMDLSTALFPAQNYGLVLSNHGGGLGGGVISAAGHKEGNTVIIEDNTIMTNMLESALASTQLFSSGAVSPDGKLGLIFYDACLMGSTELAYNTKDYYRYMVASEEITSGNTEYDMLLNRLNDDVAKAASDKEIAINLCNDFVKTDWHKGRSGEVVASIASFSSDAMTDMYGNINTLSKELSKVIAGSGYSNEFKMDVYTAIRAAALSSYPVFYGKDNLSSMLSGNDYIDLGEFMGYLNRNIDDLARINYSETEKQELTEIKDKLLAVLSSGFLVHNSLKNYGDFGDITQTNYDGVIPLNYSVDTGANVWSDVRDPKSTDKVLQYGSSIYLPLSTTGENLEKGELTKYYNNTDIQDYVQFVRDYVAFYNDDKGYGSKRTELAKEMDQMGMYSKLIVQDETNGYSNTIRDKKGNELTYFSFKIADSYEDAGIPADKIPEHTTGKPMLDILETQGSVKLTAIHREYFNAKKADGTQGVLQVDMICAEDEIGIHNYSVSGNTLVYDVTQKSQTIMDAIALDGNAYDPDKKTIDTQNVDWQFVLKSFLEESEPKKLKAVSALLSVEGNNISNYLTISGGIINTGTGNDNNYYTSTNALHVFETVDDNVYNYMGTVSYNEDETFTKFENPVAISAYHYVLYTEKNENGEVIQSYKKVLEGNDGFTDGYYAVPTNSNKAKLTLSKVGVTENIGTDKPEYTIERTAFLVDVGGGGANYSGIAYVKDPIEYIWGQNVGNGQLGEIESAKTKPDFIAGIGEFIYNDDEYKDTDTPGEDIEDDPLTNSVGNKAVGKAAGQTTDKEAGEQAYVTGAAKKVETVSDETNDETKAGEAADDETSKDVAVTGETADDETAKDEAVATGAAGDEAATAETADDETAKDEAATAETADGETTTSETANGENIPAVDKSNVTAATANVDAVDGENNPGAQSADGTASEENANVEEAEGENVPVAGGVNGTPAEEAADTAAGENNAETVGEGSPEADGQNSNSEAAVKPQEATVENADPANQKDVTTGDNNEAAKSEDSKASTEDAPVIQPVAEIPAAEPETEPVAEVPAAEPETESASDVPESSEAQPESEETA